MMSNQATTPSTPPDLPPVPAGPYLFVSYASVDRAQVLEITAALRGAGLEVWVDQAGIAGGTAYGTEIAGALRGCAAVALMCSAASLASRNVRQEIMLAWRYDRPILPFLLEPTTFPDDVAYWLEGAQWIEVLDRPSETWLPLVGRALARHGLTVGLPTLADTELTGVGNVQLDIPGNLPQADGPTIGRDRELRELQVLIGQGRWITLTGPGGTGKTRLALEAARRAAPDFPGGAWFVDLAPLMRSDAMMGAVAAALDVSEEPGRALAASVAARLGDEPKLLVVDNMEHVAAGAGEIAELLDACPGLTVLATSRIPLGIQGEWLYAVGQLALPDLAALPPLTTLAQNPAVRLFVERAREARKDFTLSEGVARPVAEICHRLDGLPLAIELAAARVRLLPPAAILARLGSRLTLLTRGGATSARQQTLRDTIAWSHELLTPSERAAFRRLAVFAGGATVDAAEAVIGSVPGEVAPSLDDIAALVDHSMLKAEGAVADDTPRVRMLETIREYAVEQMREAGEEPVLRAAHATHFLGLAESWDRGMAQSQTGTALRALRADDENLRTALDWMADQPDEDRDSELRMCVALLAYWKPLGRISEAAIRLDGALQRHPGGDPYLRARALEGVGYMATSRGDYTLATQCYEAVLAMQRDMGNRGGEAVALRDLAYVAEKRSDYEAVRRLQKAELTIRQELGDEIGVATAKHDLGRAAMFQGDYPAAIESYSAAIPTFRRLADAPNLALALTDLSMAELLCGAPDAIRHAEESLALWRTLDDRYAITYALVNLGRALQLAGRHDEAVSPLREGLVECRELGDVSEESLALYGLGLIELAKGDLDSAQQTLAESLRLVHASGEPWHIVERLEALAGLWVARGEAERAARLLGAAATLRERGGFPLPPAEQADYDRWSAAIEATLGAEGFAAAMGTGRECPLDEVVAEALGNI